MKPWLIGVLVLLALNIVLILLFLAGVKRVESACAQWEEDQIRRIADDQNTAGPQNSVGSAPGDCFPPGVGQRQQPNDDLPDNWQDLDALGSTEEAWAELRRRKTGDA